ncbi:Holliday junction resolvase RuvX [bacterium]|nr:MAG: Holliday junction resolvase RuvX [bacterium]
MTATLRILGLDYGTKTIGIALSDELGLTAQPLENLKRVSFEKDFNAIASLVAKHMVSLIVMGMPLNMDGSFGERAKAVEIFIARLKGKVNVPIATWDERLSTVAVNRVLLSADTSRKKRKVAVDKLAAAYILQGYLDSRRTEKHHLHTITLP